MREEDLLEILEIDSPEEFEYFDNMADLMEYEEHISEEVLHLFFSKTREEAVVELLGNYFEDVLESIPDESMEIYALVENIKRQLIGLIQTKDRENRIGAFVEEFYKFRQWYSFESNATCINIKEKKEFEVPLREALTIARVDKLGKNQHRYDFSNCVDYEIEDYAMGISDLVDSEFSEEDSEDFLANGYVYDREEK